MTNTESVNLTQIMEREGILRIARTFDMRNQPLGYSVYMRGNAWGTGVTVGEAYQNCLADRAARLPVAA